MIWLLACHDLAPPTSAPVDLVAQVAATRVDDGPIVLDLQIRAEPGWTVEPAIAVPDGLDAQLVAQDDTTWTFEFDGEPGSYVIPPVVATVTSPTGEITQLATERIYVDLGVDGPSSDLEGLALLEPPGTPVWPFVLLGVVSLVAITGGVVRYLLRQPLPADQPVVPVIPPDVEALTAWSRAQEQGLDDHALALELSRLFRRYIERVSPHPATSLTTYELVGRLRDDEVWSRWLEPSKGLLQATDRIKFAREEGSAEQFAQFGQDLRDIVIATRPTPEVT